MPKRKARPVLGLLQHGRWEATLRNVRALQKQLAALTLRVSQLEQAVDSALRSRSWRA